MIKLKKFLSILLTVSLMLVFPFTADAQQGTLGTENPSLQASFVNSTGDKVDGNSLEVGSYTVDIKLYGLTSISLFNLVANYTDDITISSITTAADSNNGFVCGASNYQNGQVVVILACDPTDGATTTAISNGEVMLTLNFTVVSDTAVDFADCFKIDYDIDSTFIEIDYNDGYESAYVMVGNDPTDDEYPLITEDMSPDLSKLEYTITGRITIAEDETGTNGTFGIGGLTVSVLNGDTTVCQTVTDIDGYYTLTGLTDGEYTLYVTGNTTIDRSAILIVSSDKAGDNNNITIADLPIIICDYNKDELVNATDVNAFNKYLTGDYYLYADLNADNSVDSIDVYAFSSFIDKDIMYVEVTL